MSSLRESLFPFLFAGVVVHARADFLMFDFLYNVVFVLSGGVGRLALVLVAALVPLLPGCGPRCGRLSVAKLANTLAVRKGRRVWRC